MTFLEFFCERWIHDNVTNRNAQTFLTEITSVIDQWDLTGAERSLYISNLVLMIGAYNEYIKYED